MDNRLRNRTMSAMLGFVLAATAAAQDVNLVREIVVQGNQRVNREAIIATMTTKVGSLYSQEKLDADRRALEDLGVFSAVDLRGVPVETSAAGNNWQVIVDVKELPLVKEIRVTGNTAVKTEDILRVIGVKPDQILNQRDLRPSAQAIENLYRDRGFYARVVEFGPLAESPGTVGISVVEARVGQVDIQGNKLTKPRTMRRLIRMRPGDLFSEQQLGNDFRRMVNTQWFEEARPLLDDQREIGKVDVTWDVKEARTGTFNVGLQVDPRSAIAGIVRYSQANIGGTGQSVGFDYLQATRNTGPSLDLTYSNPFIDNRDTALRLSLYSRVIFRFQGALFGGGQGGSFNNDNSYNERRNGGSIGLTRPIRERNQDFTTLGLSARFENVKTENLDPDDVGTDGFIQQDGDVAVLSLVGTRNRRDLDIDPTKGDWMQFTLEPGYSNISRVGGQTADTDIIGSNTFFKAAAEYRTYLSRGPRRRPGDLDPRKVLAIRLRYAAIAGNVPFFEQYFAGGADSVRGYPEDRFWGRQQFISTVEYRYPIQRSFSLITFVDYGGAWGGFGTVNEFSQSSSFKLHLGYGGGLSFRTPLGNIQLFLGVNDEGRSRTHFLIGNSF